MTPPSSTHQCVCGKKLDLNLSFKPIRIKAVVLSFSLYFGFFLPPPWDFFCVSTVALLLALLSLGLTELANLDRLHLRHFLTAQNEPTENRNERSDQRNRRNNNQAVPAMLEKRDTLRAQLEQAEADIALAAARLEAHDPEAALTAKISHAGRSRNKKLPKVLIGKKS